MRTRARPNPAPRHFATRLIASAVVVCVVAIGVGRAGAAPIVVGKDAPLPHRILCAAPISLCHAHIDELLRRYVDDDGLVRYAEWKRDDLGQLDEYLNEMAHVESIGSRNDSLAYWINVYNALTIRAVLHFYPLQSIKEKAGVIGFNVWDDYRIAIGAEEYSLNRIEHEILRRMGEPRIHFAIVCASIGCPRLRNEAYRADHLDWQLDNDARNFFARAWRLAVDPEKRSVRVSPIFNWFGEDFGGTDAAKLAFIARYAPESARATLTTDRVKLSYLDYDWRLNERK